MTPPEKRTTVLPYTLFIVTLLALISVGIYSYVMYQKHTNTIAALEAEKTAVKAETRAVDALLLREREEASSTITDLAARLSLSTEELEDIQRDLRREENRNEEFEDQLRDLAGTVSVLDKLSKTDRELLQKYSRTYFLNENFIPMKLAEVPSRYVMPGKKDQYFHGSAIKYLLDLLEDAKDAGHELRVISGYRSFAEQAELKGQFLQVYGSGSNAFSADQGYSEHQLGTAVDITDLATGATSESFAATEAYTWMIKNAYKYGFILSYPKGNQFYVYEPWHWRFVGRDLARDLHSKKKSFYELEQRELDEYLISIFD